MTERESKLIHSLMVEAGYQAERRLLGNKKDWVIIVNGVFLWSKEDWHAYRQSKLKGVPMRWQVKMEVSV